MTLDTYQKTCMIDYIMIFGYQAAPRRKAALQQDYEECMEASHHFTEIGQPRFAQRARLRAEAAEFVLHLSNKRIRAARALAPRGHSRRLLQILRLDDDGAVQGVVIESPAP